MSDIETLIARQATLHAVGGAVLARPQGTGLVRLAHTAGEEWVRADADLKEITLTTLIRCLWWAASAASAAEDQQGLQPPRESDLLRELDKLPPLTPDANKVLGLVAIAPNFGEALRQATGLLRAETMDPQEMVSALFEATVALVHGIAPKHDSEAVGELCILLAQMTVAVNTFAVP